MTKSGGYSGAAQASGRFHLAVRRSRRCLTALLACLAWLAGSCSIVPRELNLAPLWFHRLDEQGKLLEADAAWPLLHYERGVDGSDDFRVRPLYRRVTAPERSAVEHQFLWPLGRITTDADETYHRVWPLWSWRARENEAGKREVDWYAIFPLLWGGWHEAGDEDYFAFLPLYADIPQFATYDRFRSVLFPLWVHLDKGKHRHTLLLWPFLGFSDCEGGSHSWFRVFPVYGHDIDEGKHERRFALWPLFAWGVENEDSMARDPVRYLWVWPLFGRKWSEEVSGFSVAWPLYEHIEDRNLDGSIRFARTNVLWPLFHRYEAPFDQHLNQWWVWPLVGRAYSDDQDNWSFLWPLFWWRDYRDPDVHTAQQWALPFFWHVRQEFEADDAEDHLKIWPLAHRTTHRDASGTLDKSSWSVLSPIPWRDGNVYGVEEAYGFLWQLAAGRRRADDDQSVDVLGRMFTRRTRGPRTTASVPFLFSYESDDTGSELRLLQFLPIRLSGPSEPGAQDSSR